MKKGELGEESELKYLSVEFNNMELIKKHSESNKNDIDSECCIYQ